MRGEILKALQVQVSREIDFGLGQRIVSVNPLEPRWDDIELANHNVFRLNKRNEVVWQVQNLGGLGDGPMTSMDSGEWSAKRASGA